MPLFSTFKMAAPMKLSKTERRALKKQLRSQHTLFRHENISSTQTPTPHLIIANGGLGNSVQREELMGIFSKYGLVLDVMMKPQKPYAFVSYSTKEEAKDAFDEVHGRRMLCPGELSTPGITFYLSYVESVPGFDVPSRYLPPGLTLIKDVVSPETGEALLGSIHWDIDDENLTEGARQTLKNRRVKHFGYEFVYGINNIDPNRPLKQAIPDECRLFLEDLHRKGIIADVPDQLTINQYEPGQGIPPHIDTHSACADGILSLSLGSQVVMDFRHPDGRHVPVLLPQHSLIIMSGESRYVWTHGITPRKSDVIPIAIKPTEDPDSASVMDKTKNSKSDDTDVDKDTATSNISQSLTTGMDKSTATKKTVGSSDLLSGGMESCSINQIGESNKNRLEAKDCGSSSTERLTLVKRGVRTSFTFRKVITSPCQCEYPLQCDSQKFTSPSAEKLIEEGEPFIPENDKEAAMLERLHVHQVYEEIADHFSDTRHKAWPKVAEFVKQQPLGSVILDIGCGNGKYLGINNNAYKIGCDRSVNLCEICLSRGYPVFVGDVLAVPFRDNSCDVTISIAVIHHLATEERRCKAVQEMLRVLRPGGRALISVWALEQEYDENKSNYLSKSKLRQKQQPSEEYDPPSAGLDNNSHREMGPSSCSLEDSITDTNKNTTLSVHVNRTHFENQDLLVPWHKKMKSNRAQKKSSKVPDITKPADIDKEVLPTSENEPVYHRFYHVFREGELPSLVNSLSGAKLLETYHDKGNWCVIFEKFKS